MATNIKYIVEGTGDPHQDATTVDIADAGSYFTGTTVEAALQEIAEGTTLDTRYLKITDAQATYVPYTGATNSLDLGAFPLITQSGVVLGMTAEIELFGNPNKFGIADNITGEQAFLDLSALTADKTFTFPDASGTIALAENVIPYTGATQDVDLGNYSLTATNLTLNGDFSFISSGSFNWTIDENYAEMQFTGDSLNFQAPSIIFLPQSSAGFKIQDPTSNIRVIFDTSALTPGDKTFTFPDASGTLALETSANGSFTTADSKTVTVVNGIITSII